MKYINYMTYALYHRQVCKTHCNYAIFANSVSLFLCVFKCVCPSVCMSVSVSEIVTIAYHILSTTEFYNFFKTPYKTLLGDRGVTWGLMLTMVHKSWELKHNLIIDISVHPPMGFVSHLHESL